MENPKPEDPTKPWYTFKLSFRFNKTPSATLLYECSSPSLNCGPSGIWSNWDIPSRFVVMQLA